MKSGKAVFVGLGGVLEGCIHHVLHLVVTGIVPLKELLLVDGKTYDAHHMRRQHFHQQRPKALDLAETLLGYYPTAPLQHLVAYVDASNIDDLVDEGDTIFGAPDNHATRLLLSQ